MASDNINAAGAVTTFSLLTGLAGSIAVIAMASKFGEKRVSTSSLILAISVASVGYIIGLTLLKEGKA